MMLKRKYHNPSKYIFKNEWRKSGKQERKDITIMFKKKRHSHEKKYVKPGEKKHEQEQEPSLVPW